MTESTEKKNPSTDSICLTQQVEGGQMPPCPPPPPPLAIALEWRWLLLFPTKMTLVTHKHCLVLRKSRTRSRHRGQRSLFSPMPIKNIPPLLSRLFADHSPWHAKFVLLSEAGSFWEIIWKDGYCGENCAQTNKWIHTPMYWYKVGGGDVSLSLLLSL